MSGIAKIISDLAGKVAAISVNQDALTRSNDDLIRRVSALEEARAPAAFADIDATPPVQVPASKTDNFDRAPLPKV